MPLFNRIVFLCVINLFGLSSGRGQVSNLYFPITDDSLKTVDLEKQVSNHCTQEIAALSGPNKKYIAEIYQERCNEIKKDLADHTLITHPETTHYLEAVYEQIAKANPALTVSGIRILFSRAWWPNASSMGEGTILFNIGLFTRLENEAQVAFVICHELAHYKLDHSNKTIERFVNTVYGEDFQKELKDIKKAEYQKGKQLESLTKDLAFRSRRHSREHESSADSLAVEWLKNTPYNLDDATRCLALLDSVDKDKYDTDLLLEEQFNFPVYRFQPRWMQAPAGLSQLHVSEETENKKTLDSLKTHPDCSQRIARTTLQLVNTPRGNRQSFIQHEQTFKILQQIFDFELIEHCVHENQVSRALYFSLELLHVYPGNIFLCTTIGWCFNNMVVAQKAHTLSHLVDLPAPWYPKKYNALLQFIQNLRLPEMEAISYYYLAKYEDQFISDENFLAQLITSKDQFNKSEEKKQWIEYYHTHFKSPKYTF